MWPSRESLERLRYLVLGPRSEERAAELRELVGLEAYRLLVQARYFTDRHNGRHYCDSWTISVARSSASTIPSSA